MPISLSLDLQGQYQEDLQISPEFPERTGLKLSISSVF